MEINPKSSSNLATLGLGYMKRGEFKSAIKYFKSACEQDKSNTEALARLGNVYRKLLMPMKAVKAYSTALNCAGAETLPTLHLNLASTYHSMGNKEQTIEHLLESFN